VVGAGLAGAAAAYSLACRGYSVSVLDAAYGPAQGASALPVGLIAPHISADDAVLSRISRMGVQATLGRAQALLAPQDWQLSGVLEHRLKGKALRPQGDTQLASAQKIAQAGLTADAPALWHAQGAWLRPARLVQAQLAHPNIQCHWGEQIDSLNHTHGLWQVRSQNGRVFSAPTVVVCAAFESAALLQHVEPASKGVSSPKGVTLPLNALRGQITWGYEDELPSAAANLLPPFPVNGLGSLVQGTEAQTGRRFWMVGSTFVRGQTQTDVRLDEHQENIDKLKQLLPSLGRALGEVYAPFLACETSAAQTPMLHGWAAVRCTVPDRLPLVGAVREDLPGLHVLAGLGARGLTLSVLCGELLAAQIKDPQLDPTQSNSLKVSEPGLLKHLLASRLRHREANHRP
jgi:tRNA 5-methylaminomethyl-2-thiouridine biosynthesis bifunctional protein